MLDLISSHSLGPGDITVVPSDKREMLYLSVVHGLLVDDLPRSNLAQNSCFSRLRTSITAFLSSEKAQNAATVLRLSA